jgi:hypothetical protein
MTTKRKIFYSFHFDNDVFRVQQIRNIGALEENKPVSANEWEKVKKGGESAIEEWIDDNMHGRSCVVVLIGEETSKRKWVKHEIRKAWNEGKTLLGIYVHNINCMKNGKCSKGDNPFEQFKTEAGDKLSDLVKCYNPKSSDAYNDIKDNIEDWIEDAIENKQN